MPSGPDLLDLPLDLRQRLMVKIEAQEGIKEVLKLRLLSQSWKQAFTLYRGLSADILMHMKESAHLETVCELLRDMSSLEIQEAKKDMDFSSISRLTQLTFLGMSPSSERILVYDEGIIVSMGTLPPSLKWLILRDVKLRERDALHLPYLTRLALHLAEDIDNDLHFLSQLPKLEELLVGYASLPLQSSFAGVPVAYHQLIGVFDGALQGLDALNRLELSSGLLTRRTPPTNWQSPSALTELSLSDIKVSWHWLGRLGEDLPFVTALSLKRCQIYDDYASDEGHLQIPNPGLRSLKIQDDSDPRLLCIADEDLSELYLGEFRLKQAWALEVVESHLSRLTALTKLAFNDFSGPGALVTAETLASVKELALYNCFLTAPTFFMPGAMTSLQTLHLEGCEAVWPDYETTYDEEDNFRSHPSYYKALKKRKPELRTAATALLSLPQLSQISGDYAVKEVFLREQMGSSWECSFVLRSDLGIIYPPEHYYKESDCVKVWTRV